MSHPGHSAIFSLSVSCPWGYQSQSRPLPSLQDKVLHRQYLISRSGDRQLCDRAQHCFQEHSSSQRKRRAVCWHLGLPWALEPLFLVVRICWPPHRDGNAFIIYFGCSGGSTAELCGGPQPILMPELNYQREARSTQSPYPVPTSCTPGLHYQISLKHSCES